MKWWNALPSRGSTWLCWTNLTFFFEDNEHVELVERCGLSERACVRGYPVDGPDGVTPQFSISKLSMDLKPITTVKTLGSFWKRVLEAY
jgi:hypothetical protein